MQVEVAEERIEIAAELAVPRERAWQLLTQDRHIKAWWGGHVTLDARPGGRLREVWSDGTREVVTLGVVTCFDPPRILAMSWADDDWPGQTQVSFTLAGEDGATQIVLRHSGWRIHPPATRRTLVGAHAQGWTGHLDRLVQHAAG